MGRRCERNPDRYFNPRLREGGDKSSFSHDIRRETFQSTPPRGRRRTGHPFPSRTGDFNPRLREGGDQCDILINRLSCELFQSTPPRGRRRISVPCSSQILFISIHASAREATAQAHWFDAAKEFQSTPPRGRRPVYSDAPHQCPEFQSTPPRGRRPIAALILFVYSDFNPRLREGGDPRRPGFSLTGSRFQSTPPRGRRPEIANHFIDIPLHFNPRLREGGDHIQLPHSFRTLDFNPRLREGGDRERETELLMECYFNPRLREGGDKE